MAFEMSLPHAPRTQQLAADGVEQPRRDEQQWDLYYTVQAALQQQQEQETGAGAAADEQDGEEAQRAGKAPQPSDPAKVLEKLLTARGELDVITDLVTFVEQQQFLAVEGTHRHPPSLQERVRARSLRLAASRQQLRSAGGLVTRGLEALQAQAEVDNRFLADLAQLRKRWRLRRHSSAGGLFYADISLPLRGPATKEISQEGAQCNIIQDTNGDACVVEAVASGQRRAVRGWQHIHAVLELKQQMLAWKVVQQVVAAQAREQQHEADPDGAVAAVQRLLAVAAAACQAALHRAVTRSGATAMAGDSMEVDGPGGTGSGGGGSSSQQDAAQPAATAAAAAAQALPNGMLSSAAQDIQGVLALPGFQQQFESQALLLLSDLMAGRPAREQQRQYQQGGMLGSLLQWLQHAALRHRVSTSLHRWCAAGAGRQLRHIDSREEGTAVWQLSGARSSGFNLLVIVHGGSVRVEGAATATAAGAQSAADAQSGLSKAAFERILLEL